MIRILYVLIYNLFALVFFALRFLLSLPGRLFARPVWVRVEIENDMPLGKPAGIARYFSDSTTFLDLRRVLDEIADDPRVEGVIVEIRENPGGHLRDELVDALSRIPLRTIAFGTNYTLSGYQLASACKEIWITTGGRLYTFGPRSENVFFAGALERLGVHAQFIHIGEFKAAANRFVQSSMPASQRSMTENLLARIREQVVGEVAERRSLTTEEAQKLFSEAPSSGRRAMQLGLVDEEIPRSQIGERLEYGPDIGTAQRYIGSKLTPGFKPILPRRDRIALLDLSGMITMPGLTIPGARQVIDPEEVNRALRGIAKDRRFAGLIVHINSPGGSALGSEMIWRQLHEFNKPVAAWCTNVVASGGYYIACGTDFISCRPNTIAGSIGVITGKFSLGQSLEKIGVQVDVVEFEEASQVTSLTSALGDAAMDNMIRDTREFYRLFLQRVSLRPDLRNKKRLHRYARGRVYTGKEALSRMLIDSTDGLPAALEHISACLGKDVSFEQLTFVPHRKQNLSDLLKGSVLEATATYTEPVRSTAAVVELFRREPVLALSMHSFSF